MACHLSSQTAAQIAQNRVNWSLKMYRMYQFGLGAIAWSGYSAKIKGAIRLP
jgi:hypothetical protein